MAKEEQMTYLSANGTTKIHAVKWMPEDGKYKAILQITHGMIEYIERYQVCRVSDRTWVYGCRS